ncbi:hypothetical protein LTR86_010996 [Recurvomyces mirabilis]|nr:hypothetical protein LTR86_010996 [Recurvomyces mirabilis]
MESVLWQVLNIPVVSHLDNQFRRLREDMLAELRDELKAISSGAHQEHGGLHLRSLQFSRVHCGNGTWFRLVTLALRSYDPTLRRRLPRNAAERNKYIVENKILLIHNSMGCIIASGPVVAFATIDRNESLLGQDPLV